MLAVHTETATGIRPPEASCFSIAQHDSAIRHNLESRIRSGFGHHFDACIESFMPDLAVYQHVSGAHGVIGIRGASDEQLFLETYLNQPIESVIGDIVRQPILRSAIVEVGQFIVDDKAIIPDFFRDLVPFLQSRNYQWISFTATNRVQSLLTRVRFSGKAIAAATLDRIGNDVKNWGRYYEFDPCVIVGKLSDPQGKWIMDTE